MQLTAQAMCLEEMFSADIPEGALFYGETKRREPVKITAELRKQVADITTEMHQYYDRKYTPQVKYNKRCSACSLKDICMPGMGKAVSVEKYLMQALGDME